MFPSVLCFLAFHMFFTWLQIVPTFLLKNIKNNNYKRNIKHHTCIATHTKTIGHMRPNCHRVYFKLIPAYFFEFGDWKAAKKLLSTLKLAFGSKLHERSRFRKQLALLQLYMCGSLVLYVWLLCICLHICMQLICCKDLDTIKLNMASNYISMCFMLLSFCKAVKTSNSKSRFIMFPSVLCFLAL